MDWLLYNEDFYGAVKGDADWLYEVLWENGIISEDHAAIQLIYSSTDFDVPDCPFCGVNDNRHYSIGKNYWKCKRCRKKFSITSGRYIDNTKMPLAYWWRFAWFVSKFKIINSCAVARDLGITQKSAWHMIDTLKKSYKNAGVEMKNGAMNFESKHDVMKLLMRSLNYTNLITELEKNTKWTK